MRDSYHGSAVRLRFTVLLGLVLFTSCGDEPHDVNRPEADPEAQTTTESAPETEPPAGPVRVRYDLARHAARAELVHDGARVIDLGVPAGHQYTLGRWRTRVGRDHSFDGTTASVIESLTGFYTLPIESSDACELSLRVRTFGDRRLALYLDDETIANVNAPTDGSWEVLHVTIPSELCTRGEHDLRLRVPSTGAASGIGSAGVAVDWIRLGRERAPMDFTPVDASRNAAGELPLSDGWSLRYAFEVASGARLVAQAFGDGRLIATVERDGEDAVSERFAAREDGAPVRLDLSPHEGSIVRLTLSASGDLRLRAPAIVTDGAREMRPARAVRNVIIYLTDTLRADHLSPYAPNTRVQTPGLNAWAENAATFVRGHAQENWTKPSCATLLSGLYPWEHHATGEDSVVPGSVLLLSEHLREQGFYTGAFIANGFVSDRFGFRQGWNTWRNYVREGRRNMARFVADDVIEWLDERPTDQPFFLYVHTIDPHVPYIPPSDDLALYDSEPYEGIVDFHRDRQLLEGIKSGRIPLNARDRIRLEALYDGEVTYHDRHFDRMMQALDEHGLADDTIVVFTSDHGEEFFDHDSVGHGHSVWEELIRVPLIVRWPGVTDAGGSVDEAVGLVDVMPTMLDALELETPDAVSGRSLATLLRGGTEDAPRPTVTGFMNGWRTIVVGRYKLIQRTTAHISLYDLTADPGEQHDLATERPLSVRYLRGLLGMTLADAVEGHDEAHAHIDDALREQLEALGYTGTSRAPTGD